MHEHRNKRKFRDFAWKKIMIPCLVFVALIIIGGILFVKFDTGAAATFADQVLRPAIGDSQVIFLENLYFNASDAINRLTFSIIKPTNSFIFDNSVPIPNGSNLVGSSTLDLSPIVAHEMTSIGGGGVWRNVDLGAFPSQIVMAETFVNPDPSRPYAFVTLAQMDMSKLRLWSVAGTQEPGGKVGKPGSGVIPQNVQDQGSLVAAFDGGFQYRDGQYGMIVGTTTYLPLKYDLATLIGYTDGSLSIVKYEGQNLGTNIAFIRQNCPMLIENGVIESQNQANKKLWGRTVTSGIYTWRSGIGITANGNLVYAVGNSLVPSTLAAALKAAGAVNAMQLDINPYWVRFNIFNGITNGVYSHSTIMKGVYDGSYSYLHGYQKDFFYVTKKVS